MWGGFILAELTQPFDQGGLTHCFPWMQRVDARLGYRPGLAAFDTAFDVRYVDAHSHRENENPRSALRPYYSLRRAASNGRGTFAPDGRPRRAVRLSMPLQFTYADRTTCLVEQERGKYACPLRFSTTAARTYPVRHPNCEMGGCTAMTPALAAQATCRGDTRTHENGAYPVANGWCEVDAHGCHEPEPQADPTN